MNHLPLQGDVLPSKTGSFKPVSTHDNRVQAPEAIGASWPHNQLRAAVQRTKVVSPARADDASHDPLTANASCMVAWVLTVIAI